MPLRQRLLLGGVGLLLGTIAFFLRPSPVTVPPNDQPTTNNSPK